MGILLILVVLLALLAVFALLLGYWETPEQIKQQIMGFTRKPADPPVEFRAWAERSLGDNPQLQSWLLSLPEEGFKALTQRVAAFCADLGLRLSWLAERHLEVAPGLQQDMQTIVVHYLEACRQGIHHQGEIVLFSHYQKLIADPADSRHRDIRRRLFTRLIADSLAEPLPAYELIMASELQRQALAAKTIREVAGKDWQALAEILSAVLAEQAESPQVGGKA
jgi:hypothetical protein